MKNNCYYYGTQDVPKIPNEVLEARIELLQTNLSNLLNHSYYLDRDTVRINDILKAIKFYTVLKDSNGNTVK
jgi:hypothetical protein